MKLAVCGCSWSSRDPEYPGTEFGQFLADYLNVESYVNLAKPGCSNFGIALQVDYALKHYNPDLFIINATTATRTEFILPNKRYYPSVGWDSVTFSMGKLEKSSHELAPGYKTGYDPSILIDSYGSIFDDDISKNLKDNPFSDRYDGVFTESTFEIFKKWFLHFYNADIDKHKQFYMLQSVFYKLQKHNKKFVFSPNTFDWAEAYDLKDGIENEDLYTETTWDIDSANFMQNGISSYLYLADDIYGSWQDSPGTQMSHHLPVESQLAYFTDLLDHIKLNNLDK